MNRTDLFGEVDMVAVAIQHLRDYEPPDGYYLAFSGGKDSIVIKQLAIEAGVKFDAHYNVTTIDPPELIRFIRKHHPDVAWDRPEKPFLAKMLDKRFPPLRHQRWCCKLYKEGGGEGQTILTGIRWEESPQRKTRQMYEPSTRLKNTWYLHPIIDWASDELWSFIRDRELPYCELYDQGWHRLGCLFCPMQTATARKRERKLYPKWERLFRRWFQRLYDHRESLGLENRNWANGDEMFEWWMRDDRHQFKDENQITTGI